MSDRIDKGRGRIGSRSEAMRRVALVAGAAAVTLVIPLLLPPSDLAVYVLPGLAPDGLRGPGRPRAGVAVRDRRVHGRADVRTRAADAARAVRRTVRGRGGRGAGGRLAAAAARALPGVRDAGPAADPALGPLT